jgi:hypothetical protein
MKNKRKQWFETLKKIADNRRILTLLFITILVINFILHFLTYKFILNDVSKLSFNLVTYVLSPLFDGLSILTTVVMFLILRSLFKKSRLYSALQWILITIIMLVSNFVITELQVIFITWEVNSYLLYVLWESILDPGISNVVSYFTYDGDLMGAFEYFTNTYRLIPLLSYLLPFLRFILSFRKPKEATEPKPAKVKKPVWATFWTFISTLVIYQGCMGLSLFILVLPAAKTIEGYEPYYIFVYLFLAGMFVPFIVLGAFGIHHFKPKTTSKFKYNHNFVNGFFNIVAVLSMLGFALICFVSNNIGIADYPSEVYVQMGWISLVISAVLAANVFRILLQNKPLWKIEEEEAAQRVLDESVSTELRSPVGIAIPFSPDEPKEENNG